MPQCNLAAHSNTPKPCNSLRQSLFATYVALHKWKGAQMTALIERLLDAMFAPLARELERLPPQAMRFGVFF